MMDFFGIANGVISTIEGWGYIGIFIIIAIESFAIPLPAEIVLIPAGFLVAEGKFSLIYLILISTIGSLVGSLISYFIAFKFGRKGTEKLLKRYKTFTFLNKRHLNKSESFFKNNGPLTIFLSRFIPGFRHIISFPAGFSKMNLLKFSIYTLIGSGIYNSFLILIGYFAGTKKEFIWSHFSLVFSGLLILFVISLIVYIKLKKKSR